MWRPLSAFLALALASCVPAGPAVVSQDDPVSIAPMPLPSGGAPTFFKSYDDAYVGYPELGRFIRGAAAVGDNLLIVGESGTLVVVNLGDGQRRTVATDALDVIASGDRAWIIRRTTTPPVDAYPSSYGGFVVSSWIGGSLQDLPPIELSDEDVLRAFIVHEDVPVVVLGRSVFALAKLGDGWIETTLHGQLDPSSRGGAAIASTGELYVGADLGEFGGGMQRVDLETGAVVDLCREPEGMCTNVTAVVPDPRHAGCVIVTEGIWHMALSSGSVTRVCRDRSELILHRPLAREQFGRGDVGPSGSEQFTALAVTPDGRVWAAGMGAVYEIDGDRKLRHPLPPLAPLHQLYAIRSLPGLLVLFDGAGVTCGPALQRMLAEGSPSMPSPDACGFTMDGWSPRLVALRGIAFEKME